MSKTNWKYKRYLRPRQKKTYTMLGLTLLSLIIFGIFAIRPTITTIIELRKKIRDQEEVCERLDRKLRDLSLAQTELRKVSTDLPIIERALPIAEGFSDLIKDIHLTSEKNDLRLEHIRFDKSQSTSHQPPNQTLTIQALPFHARIEGNFPQFLDFLRGIQNTPRILSATEIRVTGQRKGQTESFDVRAEAYFQTDE